MIAIMGAVFGIPQPIFNINVIGQRYQVMQDDPMNGLVKGDIIVPTSYRVIHGISSMIAHAMYLETRSGKKLPVQIYEDDESYYFYAPDRYPEHDSTKYKDEGYNVTLRPTSRLVQL